MDPARDGGSSLFVQTKTYYIREFGAGSEGESWAALERPPGKCRAIFLRARVATVAGGRIALAVKSACRKQAKGGITVGSSSDGLLLWLSNL